MRLANRIEAEVALERWTMTERLRIGIIGAGGRGIQAFGVMLSKRADSLVAALCDPNPHRMTEAGKTLGCGMNCYAGVEAMLDKERLDAVVVASPDYCHGQNVVAALRHGVNVLVDKPLATTVKECLDIINAAREAGKLVMMGFNLRHDPTIARLKEIVDSGTLGRLILIESREFYNGGRTYMARWNRKYECSGGLWVHKGSHDFDVFNWLLGFPRPVKVSAVAGVNVFRPENIPFDVKPDIPVGPTCLACAYKTICPDVAIVDRPEWTGAAQAHDRYAKDLCMYTSDKNTHDNGIAIVEYENGARAGHLECFVCSFDDRRYTVVGDRGIAEASLAKRTILIYPRWRQETILHQLSESGGGHGGADPSLIDAFVRVLKGEIQNTSTIRHGLWSTAIGQASELSVRENRMVFVDELFKNT